MMLPRPGEDGPFKNWFIKVTIPAKTGEETEVPPTMDSNVSTALEIPLTHVLVLVVGGFCGVQKMYPGKFGEARSDTSGT